MNTKIAPEILQQLQIEGVAITGSVGGLKKTRYWTPDGRELLAVPAMRTYVRRVNGKVIEEGLRDANLDRGWLLQPPTELKLYCSGCDNWHDTQEEIDNCVAKKKAFEAKWSRKAKGMHKEGEGVNEEKIAKIEGEISEIKNLLTKLLKREV